MKTKKSSLSLILALVMVLAMSCGAWAATGIVQANGGSKDASGDITATGDSVYGLFARIGGTITYTGPGTISTAGDDARGVSINGIGSKVTMTGAGNQIITSGDSNSHGVFAANESSADITSDIITYGDKGNGLQAAISADVTFVGNITTYGPSSRGITAVTQSIINATGNIEVSGLGSTAVNASDVFSEVTLKGSILVSGDAAVAATATAGTVNVLNGDIIVVSNRDDAWAFAATQDGVINLDSVNVEAENLFRGAIAVTAGNGTLNGINSTLTGDIVSYGNGEEILTVNLTDSSVWNGATEASTELGVIDINLGNSQWNVTGDSNTNGKVTADEGSKVDFNGTTDNITVIIDSLAGDPDLTVKLGDKLIIKNPAGSVESSNPDVIEVVENEDGSIEIIFKGDGEAELTYDYIDENGKIQTGTVSVVSGAGSIQASTGGGGSSNCNTGVGAALFALLGLAFIQKRK